MEISLLHPGGKDPPLRATRAENHIIPVLAFGRNNRNVRTAGQTVALERHNTVNQGKERMVFAQTYILPRMVLCTPLTYNDIARSSHLATEKFHTQAFAF